MNSSANPPQLVQGFIRGEVHWTGLQALGLNIEFSDNSCVLDESKPIKPSKVEIRDIVRGLLNHQNDYVHLREWAAVVLAASFLDLSVLEEHAQGEMLLEALWDASSGREIPQEVFDWASSLS